MATGYGSKVLSRSCCSRRLPFHTESLGHYFGVRLDMANDEHNEPNHPAAGKAGIASRLTIEHYRPGVPEPGR